MHPEAHSVAVLVVMIQFLRHTIHSEWTLMIGMGMREDSNDPSKGRSELVPENEIYIIMSNFSTSTNPLIPNVAV